VWGVQEGHGAVEEIGKRMKEEEKEESRENLKTSA
jgi:hypothetical protein